MRLGETSPSREESAALDQPMVPVTRRLLADGETAVGIYRKLAGNRPGDLLVAQSARVLGEGRDLRAPAVGP